MLFFFFSESYVQIDACFASLYSGSSLLSLPAFTSVTFLSCHGELILNNWDIIIETVKSNTEKSIGGSAVRFDLNSSRFAPHPLSFKRQHQPLCVTIMPLIKIWFQCFYDPKKLKLNTHGIGAWRIVDVENAISSNNHPSCGAHHLNIYLS